MVFTHHRIQMESDIVSMWIIHELWIFSILRLVLMALFVHLVHLWEHIFNECCVLSLVDTRNVDLSQTQKSVTHVGWIHEWITQHIAENVI